MMTHHLQGNAYVKTSEVKVGTRLRADGDFTCLPKDAVLYVFEDGHGLFVECSEGKHRLEEDDYDGYFLGWCHVK